MKAFCTLLKIELKLNIRNRNMVIFAIILPLVVLAILGILYGTGPAAAGADYTFLEQSMGALCAISICAGGLMGLPLVVAEYRERKILKRFFVTPINPGMLLAAELLIYALYALASLIALLLASGLIWGVGLRGSWAGFLGSWLLTIFSTLSIGMMVGGIARNAKSAGTIACALYFPMLIFSGATLPFEVMPEVMQKIVAVFPMTQGIHLLKAAFLGLNAAHSALPVVVMLCVALVCSGIAVKCFRWE